MKRNRRGRGGGNAMEYNSKQKVGEYRARKMKESEQEQERGSSKTFCTLVVREKLNCRVSATLDLLLPSR